ncbi:MAG: carbohydrate binding family 9 domain-containing protein [Gemmatimonadaceae bacterium]|nr:carbohydrate binding family 9 domain-containing protein [Gemmatimonadaceae bacterium]
MPTPPASRRPTTTRLAALLLVLLAGPTGLRAQRAPTLEPPPDSLRPRLAARRATGPIRLDGRLDEPDWATAAVVTDWPIVRPDYAPRATQRTVVRVLYDARALYIGAEMADSAAASGFRVQNLARDFNFSENENLGVTLSGIGDRRTAYQFNVTPWGNQRDVEAFNGGDATNESWDALWRVRTSRSATGWVAELAIPWESLRYAPGATAWDVNFVRNARRTLETSAWSPYPRQFASFRLTYAGILDSLKPPPPRTNLRVRPYVLGEAIRREAAAGGAATVRAAGGEVIWAPSANVVVEGTLNTDFAQADVDRQVVNLTRFPVFFPERRQFFLESADVLGARGLTGAYAVQPFFSRRIGLGDDGTPIPVAGGGRATYRSGSTTAGALLMRQRATATSAAATFGIVRGSRVFGRSGNVGALLAVRDDEAGPSAPTPGTPGRTNIVTAFDGLTRIGEQIQVNGMISTSTVGLTSPAIVGTWQPSWRPSHVVWFKPAIVTFFYHDPSSLALQEGVAQGYVDVYHRSGTLWYPFVERHWQRPTAAVPLFPGVTVAPGGYDYWRTGLVLSTDPSARVSLRADVATGGFFDGSLDRLSGTARWAPDPRVAMALAYDISRLRRLGTADTSFVTQLYGPELRLAANPRLQLVSFYQYNTAAKAGALNARLSWEFSPLSFLYVIWNRREPVAGGSLLRQDALLVKLAWLGQV